MRACRGGLALSCSKILLMDPERNSKRARRLFAALAVLLIGCGPEPKSKGGPPTGPEERAAAPPAVTEPVTEKQTARRLVQETRTGPASYISSAFHGNNTASGEVYDQDQLVAAHPSYPLGTTVRVTNLTNRRVVEVRVIDRSAAAKRAESPIIDVSRAAAQRLGFVQEGTARVRTEVLEWGGERQ